MQYQIQLAPVKVQRLLWRAQQSQNSFKLTSIIVVIKKRDEDRGNVQCYQTFPGRDYVIILWDGTYGTGHYELIGYENIDR